MIGSERTGIGTVTDVLTNQITIDTGAGDIVYYTPDVDISMHFTVAEEASVAQGRRNSVELDVLFANLSSQTTNFEGKSAIRGLLSFEVQQGSLGDSLQFELQGATIRVLDIESTIRCRQEGQPYKIYGYESYRLQAMKDGSEITLENGQQTALGNSLISNHLSGSFYIFDTVLDTLEVYRTEIYASALSPKNQ